MRRTKKRAAKMMKKNRPEGLRFLSLVFVLFWQENQKTFLVRASDLNDLPVIKSGLLDSMDTAPGKW